MNSTNSRWWRGEWAARRAVLALALVAVVALPAAANVIGFDLLLDGEQVTNQYVGLGVTFTNATAIAEGVTLNEVEFPARSRANIVFDAGGPIEITFADLMASVAGYFTYLMPLQFTAYDDQGLILSSVSTLYNSNLGAIPDDPLSGGDPGSIPNELLQVTSAVGISRVVITGDSAGGSFTLDDLTFQPLQSNAVPEPSTLLLVALGLVGVGRRRGLTAG